MRRMIVLSLLLAIALPAAAQDWRHQMRVEPSPASLAVGQYVPLKITYNLGGAWAAAPADQWNTLVQPEGLGRVEATPQGLRFVATAAGTGRIHVWHKSQLAWFGLSVQVAVTVKPADEHEHPEHPKAGGVEAIRLFRTDLTTPAEVGGRIQSAARPGETLHLAAYGFTGQGHLAGIDPVWSVQGSSLRLVSQERHRAVVQVGSSAGEEEEAPRVTVTDRRTGLSAAAQLRVRGGAESVKTTLWVKVGLGGAWELAAGHAPIRVQPGSVLFVQAVATGQGGRPVAIHPRWHLEHGAGSTVHPFSPQIAAVMVGFGDPQGQPAKLHLSDRDKGVHDHLVLQIVR